MSESGRLRESRSPAYDLANVHAAFKVGRFMVSGRVIDHMWSRGWDPGTVRACVASMRAGSFHKSQQSHDGSGAWLDIYRPYWCGERWYVKIVAYADGGEVWFRVPSFCLDGERH